VTDRQTDERTDGFILTNTALHSMQRDKNCEIWPSQSYVYNQI